MPENQVPETRLGDYLRDYLVVVAAIIGLSFVFTQGNVLSYLPVLFASGLRNVYFPGIGNGVLFSVTVFVGFLVEGVVVTALLRLGMRLLKVGR